MEKFAYYTKALKNYVNFEGRANRSEFWYFVLFNFIISIVLVFVSKSLANIYSLAVLIPSLAIGARRLHDIGRSGWMQLVGLIPILGWIWLIVLFIIKSNEGENNYGKPSKGLSHEDQKDLKDLKEKAQEIAKKVEDKVEDATESISEKAEDVVKDIKE